MTPEKARKQANNIMEMFWHNFLKAESAFVMRDVIAIALENATNQTELPRGDEHVKEPTIKVVESKPPIKTFTHSEEHPRHYDSQGYCDNPARGY